MAKPLLEFLQKAADLAGQLEPVPIWEGGGAVRSQRGRGAGSGGEEAPRDPRAGLLAVLESMTRDVTDDVVTVGIIGITSCGKSSVINSMMGRKLLVQRVKPSSNILVKCRRDAGSPVRAEICYTPEPSGKTAPPPQEIALGDPGAEDCDALAGLVKSLSDESENQGNRLGVDHVKIWTPEFRLGDGVTLTDTPGLKAYGCPQHEELTWAFFAPTVDVALFLCTAKSESDADNLKFLRRLRDGDKVTVVAQNMKDSVVGEVGPGGEVRKTPEENLEILKARLARTVKAAFGEEGCPPIFQISAREAADPEKWDRSGFPELIDCLQSKLAVSRETLDLARARRFARELAKLIPAEQAAGGQGAEVPDTDAEIASAAATLREIADEYESFRARYTELAGRVRERSAFFRSPECYGIPPGRMGRRDGMGLAEARRILDELTAFVNGTLDGIVAMVNETSGKATAFARTLEVDERSIRDRRASFGAARTALAVPTDEVRGTRKVQEEGILGSAKRLLGRVVGVEWGQKEEGTSEHVVNFARLRAEVERELSGFQAELSVSITEAFANVEHWYTQLAAAGQEALARARERDVLRKRVETNDTVLREFERLLSELSAAYPPLPARGPAAAGTGPEAGAGGAGASGAAGSRPSAGPSAAAAASSAGSSWVRAEVSRTALELMSLAMTAGAEARLSARSHYLENPAAGEFEHAVVLGWDPIETGNFLSDFWFDFSGGQDFGIGKVVDENDGHQESYVSVRRYSAPRPGLPGLTVLFAKNNARAGPGGEREHIIPFTRLLGDQPLSKTCVFYLTEGLQAGESAATLLGEDELVSLLMGAGKLVLTLQSFAQFASGPPDRTAMADFAESLWYLKDSFVREGGLAISSFMANSRDLGISVLGDLFFRSDAPLRALNDSGVMDRFARVSDPSLLTMFVEGLVKAEREGLRAAGAGV
ncbi:MAG: dynamin family protein [Deltaproteobacteria bacterium]|jgi:hypothetical protein|nr:dynamin family protein [Deltaproteobacteria bacterium]